MNNSTTPTVVQQVLLLNNRLAKLEHEVNHYWILSTSYSIFFMQLGFLLLESGSVMSKNVKSIMMKNLLDTFGGAVLWYLCGFYVYLYFNDVNAPSYEPIASTKENEGMIYSLFLQTFTFANCASTIASGGSASRMKSMGHLWLVLFLTAWIYPVFAHWLWSTNGWLHQLGAVDFAGGSSVHMVGGIAALFGAISVGPRHGRFIKTIHGILKVREIKGHNAVLVMIGTCVLWYGWFNFNGGSSGYINELQTELRATASVNTLIGGCIGGLTIHAFNVFKNRNKKTKNGIEISWNPDSDDTKKNRQFKQRYEFNDLPLGILGGLVAVTPCGPFIPVWAAILTSVIGVIFGAWVSEKLIQLGIDDPVDAFSTHVPAAMIGLIATGLFGTKKSLKMYGLPTCTSDTTCSYGLFLGGGWYLLGVQCLLIVICIAWSMQAYLVLEFYKRFGSNPENPPCGFDSWLYRFTKQEEKLGLDLAFYDGYAYPDQNIPEALILHSDIKNVKRIKLPGGLKNRAAKAEKNVLSTENDIIDFRKTVLELPAIDLKLGGKYFIRVANSNDAKKIFDLVNNAYEVEKDESSDVSFKSLNYYQHVDDVKNGIKAHNAMTYFVAIDTDSLEIVGVIGLTMEVSSDSKKKKKKDLVFKISPFAINVADQNKGIGKKLIEFAVAKCNKEGIGTLAAWVINWRSDLFEIYEKLGFAATKATRDYVPNEHDPSVKEGTYLILYQRHIPVEDTNDAINNIGVGEIKS